MVRRIKDIYHLFIACLALVWFRFPARHLVVVGVTGTDGKTTTTTLIYHILKSAGKKTSMITSVHAVIAGHSYDTGFHVTTPNAWWVQKYLREAVDHGDTHMVLEVTSHALSQHRVFGIRFAVGVITNVTHEHLDWHKTYREYFETKMKLFAQSDVAIINMDQKDIRDRFAHTSATRYIAYGMGAEATVNPKSCPFTTKLPGEYNQYNCLAALSAGRALGIDMSVALKAIAQFSGIPGRMETVATKPFRVIVDFAHTPNALEQALKTVRAQTTGRVIHVFGSAGLRDHTKRPRMGAASARYADCIVLTEEDYRTEQVNQIIDEIMQGIPKTKLSRVYRYPDREEAVTFALSQARVNDTVIITGKGHEKSLCRGTVEYPWSDQEAVRRILKTLSHVAKK